MGYRETKELVSFWRDAIRKIADSHGDAQFILAEISKTEGSTYRKTGSKKIISVSGEAHGLLSGGCLEAAIVREGLRFLNEGAAADAMFDTSHETDRLLGYQKGCRGKIWVHYSKLPAYSVASSEKLFPLLKDPKKIVVYGCGPDAIPLSSMLGQMGWPHIVVDHRNDLLIQENFKSADEVVYEAPTTSGDLAADGDAVILMTHNFEADLNIMKTLAAKKLAYLGVLGPRSRFDQLLADLKSFLHTEWPEALGTVTHAPIGIKMQCQDPDDIALSIVAQIAALQIFAVEAMAPFASPDSVWHTEPVCDISSQPS